VEPTGFYITGERGRVLKRNGGDNQERGVEKGKEVAADGARFFKALKNRRNLGTLPWGKKGGGVKRKGGEGGGGGPSTECIIRGETSRHPGFKARKKQGEGDTGW